MFDKSRMALTKCACPTPSLHPVFLHLLSKKQASEQVANLPCSHAMEVQSSLDALVNKCENVQSDLSKLEKNNNDLQEYIGGLTRSMSKSTDLSSTGRKK